MKIGSAFSSKYLKGDDIPDDHPVTVRIDRIEIEDVGGKGKKEEKPVAYFVGKAKGMVLNKTNAKVIANAYGDETDEWHGKAIQIFSTEVEFQGDMVNALRVRIPKPAAPQNGGGQAAPVSVVTTRRDEIRNRPPAEPPLSEEPVFADDDIPF